MNKADLLSNINTKLASASGITAQEHREVLGTDADSVVESIYGSSVADSQATETITTANADFDYSVTFNKVGSSITVTGSFLCNNSVSVIASQIFALKTGDWENSLIKYNGFAVNTSTNEAIPIFISGGLSVFGSILAGESFNFSITYRALN